MPEKRNIYYIHAEPGEFASEDKFLIGSCVNCSHEGLRGYLAGLGARQAIPRVARETLRLIPLRCGSIDTLDSLLPEPLRETPAAHIEGDDKILLGYWVPLSQKAKVLGMLGKSTGCFE